MAVPFTDEQVPHEDIEVSVASDFTIHINEFDPATRQDERFGNDAGQAGANRLVRTASVKVQKGILVERSQYFRAMFDGRWGPKKDSVILNEDTVRSMELWLREFHSTTDALPKQTISVEEVWHTIMAGDKYGSDLRELKSWFVAWYTEMRNESGKKFFEEFGPNCSFPAMPSITLRRADESILAEQLNAAKGRLRTILHQALFNRVNQIVDVATCACKERTVFDYLKELQRIEVSPLDMSSTKASVADMLDRLGQYDGAKTRAHAVSSNDTSGIQSRQSPCFECRLDGKVIVQRAISRVASYFDGLCLDCMDRTKGLRVEGNKDDDYWSHNAWKDSYDRDCRISHNEPTWYFSFMGRKEKRGLIAE
ncbi:uncharacterized protein CDV56_107643 [Aspergillus thermomutatus]|uniref:BTB domain-containing protein n=1 Tax=Aspergillus thermomutatus TaxID=41047 RepID=A0A397HPY6_ASPTH|nr:uncharacterized protein CDV56_107643 [Aspergillus thermomutatus]RHZ63233.1 hypothetical protein CDV56_107643 [Aspergillus thermomutatus]